MRLSAAILIFAISGMVAFPLSQVAQGQELTITTSADGHVGIFFGEGVLQIVITDPGADDDSSIEDVTLRIDADPDSGSGGSLSVSVPETSQSSGRFEFYLVHEEADAVAQAELDEINSRGVEGDGICVSDCAPFITFGPSGELQVDADLYEDVSFDLTAGDVQAGVKYEETLGQIELDRSAYGSDSFVYVFINDQDANLNPTKSDEFIVDPGTTPNNDLFALDGGSIESAMTFRETGDNTARFEGRYELGSSIAFESEALVLTLNDKANYNDTLAAGENDSQSTDEVSFTIGNTDGTIDVGGNQTTWDPKLESSQDLPMFGGNATIRVEDPDANVNQAIAEDIDLELSTSYGTEVITALETDRNTGIFEVTLTFSPGGLILGTELRVQAGGLVSISYIDKKPADYAVKIQNGQDPEKEFALTIRAIPADPTTSSTSLTSPAVSGISGILRAGNQVGLSTTIKNNDDYIHPFVALIEVRDSGGITAYIAWQNGTLASNESSSIDVSWTPENSGDYEVRTFAVSSLSDAFVLSEIASKTIHVA